MSSNENRNPVAEDFLQQLRKDYDLSDKDFWYHAESDCWILYHDACMRIAYLAGVEFDKPEWISAGANGHWAVVVSGTLDSRSTWTTGEASVETSYSPYFCAMAEKRGKDRLVLDLLGAYALGIKSDIEADDFSRAKVRIHDHAVAEVRKLGSPDDKIKAVSVKLFGKKGVDWQRLSVDQLRDLYRNLKPNNQTTEKPEGGKS
jgi:hypothetical protein|tara:strand:+ start:12563 stop:13171 length:609 start_codon:yes stop_codon:yes gene_type:complete